MSDSGIYIARDRVRPDEWRVEYFDADGGCYVTLFAGPDAERRALDYGAAVKSGSLKRYEAA